MENKTKRFLRLLLVIAMAAAILPMTFALATETGYVAKIGDTEYATLQAAMTEANKAAGNYTITLLKDSAEVFTFAQKSGVNITIDGDGHTFSGKITLNAGGGNLTFTDAKIAPANSQTIYLNASTAPNVTFDGCVLQGVNKSGAIVYAYASATSNALAVTNCTADNLQYIVSCRQTGSNSVLVENVTATNMIYLVRTLKCPSVTVKNVTCDAVIGIDIKNDGVGGKLILENVNINVYTYGGTVYYPVSGSGAGKSWTVEVKGDNIFTANGVPYEASAWFSGNAGYEIKHAENAVVNNPDHLVAEVDGKQYFSLQYAINAAAKAGKPVQLIADINLGSDIVVLEQDVTLDLNGHTISGTGTAVFQVGSTFTLVDSVGNGAIKHTGSKDSSTAISIANGNFIMESGSVISNHKAVQGGGSNKTNTITIKGGVINGTDAALNINKGSNTVSITGGKLVGGYAVHVAAGNGQVVTAFTVSGGEFTGALPEVTAVTNGKLSITGGTFTVDPSAYVAEGYAANKQNGIWSVVEFAPVAEINGTQYKSLQAAINDAQAGDTIKFLTDITENVTVNKNVTIDGAGKTYTGKITISGDYDVTVQNVNFVKGEIVQNGAKTSATLVVKGCSFTKGGYAITTERIKNLTIENCTVTGQSLLYAKLTTSNITVKNVTVEKGNYVAYLMYGSQATFENVTATNMTGFGICTMNYGPKTITLKNCSFDAPNYYALAVGDDNSTAVDTFVFEGENSMKPLHDSQYAKYVLTEGATLTAPEGYDVTTNVEGYTVSYAGGKYALVQDKVVATVDDVPYADWASAKNAIKAGSVIVLYDDIVNDGSFGANATLDLNGHKFTTTTIGQSGHHTLHITDNSEQGGGSVVVTNFTYLYANGYLNLDSKINFNSEVRIGYTSGSTGCLLIDGVKWIGLGHFQQTELPIFDTTGGTVTIKNNFQSITFNSGKFILNATADFADFAGTQNITVNAGTTLDLNGNILTTDSIVAFSELIDTAQDKTGGIKVSTENISLMQNKTYMPIYDSENGCFRFYKFNMVSLGVKELNEAGSAVKFGVAIRFDKVEAYGLLADGNNYSYLTLEFVLTLENMDVPTIAYEFAAEQFTTWAANAYTHYNSGKAGDRALVLTVGGLDKLDAGSKLTVAPTLTSEVTKFSVTSVVMEAPAVAPTSTNSTDPTNKDEETENGGNSESGAAGGDDNTGA